MTNGSARIRFEVIGEAWQLFTSNAGTWIGAMLAYFVLILISAFIPYIAVVPMVLAPDSSAGFFMFLVAIGGTVVISLVVQSLLMGGMFRLALKQIRGLPTSAGDVFQSFDLVPRFIVASLIIGILAAIGYVFCIIPGLIVVGTTFLAFPLMADTEISPLDAIARSFEVLKRDMLMAVLFFLVLAIVANLGVILCYVGVIVTMPLLFLGTSLVYRDFFPERFSSEPLPSA